VSLDRPITVISNLSQFETIGAFAEWKNILEEVPDWTLTRKVFIKSRNALQESGFQS
jgi:hypothetical protein